MLIDTQLKLSALQSLIHAVGDVVSTNVIDTGAAADTGIGEGMRLVVRVGTAVLAAGGASTMQFVLQTSTDEAFSSPVEVQLSGAIAKASLTANTVVYSSRLPQGLLRYLRVVYRIATNDVTAGTADAFLVKDQDAQQYVAKNFTVS